MKKFSLKRLLGKLMCGIHTPFREDKPCLPETKAPDGFKIVPLPVNESANKIREIIDIFNQKMWSLEPTRDYMIAGGAVRLAYQNKPLAGHDLDVFFTHNYAFRQAVKYFGSFARLVCHTTRAATFEMKDGLKVQLINKKFFNSYQELLESFDFTVCQFSTDGNTIMGSLDGFECLETNTLRHNSKYSLTTAGDNMIRLTKYVLYGFTPEPEMLTNTIKRILDPNTMRVSFGNTPVSSVLTLSACESFYDVDAENKLDNEIEEYENFDGLNDDDLKFVQRNCMLTKLSNDISVGKHGQKSYVFINGYPLTTKMFYVAISKVVFGNMIKLRPSQTRFLDKSLGHLLGQTQANTSYNVAMKVITDTIGWESEKTQGSYEAILGCISDIENQLISLDQQPQQ